MYENSWNNIINYYYNKLGDILIIVFCFYIIIYFRDPDLIYKKYIEYCRKGRYRNYNKNINLQNTNLIYISICIPVYNMEKYIEQSLLSILNQSFKNYEIIFVNDNSNDKTIETIEKFQNMDKRIKIINHQMKQGVYCSRKDAILNAFGEFILMMDPDDMFLNKDLFKELYNYNSKYNLDINEFIVYHQIEGENKIYKPVEHLFNHWHNFGKTIIYQPELSNIIFYIPKSNNISSIICRTIWNKLIKREIMIKAVNYVEKIFKSKFLITADDTPINIMVFNFAKNFSNIKIPGYLYIKRNISMSRGKNIKELDKIRGYNYLLYFKFLFTYVKEFKKDINFFLKEFDEFHHFLYLIKNLNISYYIPKAIVFFKKIRKIHNIPKNSRLIINKLILYFTKKCSKKYAYFIN